MMKSFLGFSFLVVFAASSANAADGYQTWVENMTCGKIQYRIESVCKPSKESMSLNTCKSQTLSLVNSKNSRTIKMPDLSKESLSELKDVKLPLSSLFATSWRCVALNSSQNVLEIFYDDGSLGHSELGEQSSVYDENGDLIQTSDDLKLSKNLKLFSETKKKSIHSILPNK